MNALKLLFLTAALASTGCQIDDFDLGDLFNGGGGGGGSHEDPGGEPGDGGEGGGEDPMDPPPPPPPVSVPEPSSYFPFDQEVDADLCDDCHFVDGLFNDAILFNGNVTGHSVPAPLPNGDAATSETFSLSFWAFTSSEAPVGWSFSVVMLENLGLEVAHYDSGHSLMMYDGRYGGRGNNANENQWYHFVVTSDGMVTTLYLDGVAVATQPGEGRHAENIRIYPGVPIDELRVYDSVLSAEQINALHQAGAH